jgi:spore maturation protein CgeB
MRFTFLTTLYANYVEAFYAARPGLEVKSYAEQKAALDHDGFAWNGGLEPALAALGYEVQAIYANVAPLQKAWMREHAQPWPATRWLGDVALRQVAEFGPEILWVDSLAEFPRRWMEQARSDTPQLRRIFGYTGVDVRDAETVKACDAIFASIMFFVDGFRRGGTRSHLFRHAFNPDILTRLPPRSPVIEDVLFAGSIARGEGDHLERERLIEALVEAVPTTIRCPQGSISYRRDWVETNLRRGVFQFLQTLRRAGVGETTLERLPVVGRAADWTKPPLSQINPRLHSRMQPAVFGLEMFAALQRHAVSLNRHIDLARAEAGNIRMFEVTGVGACLLTDWKANVAEMFEVDREVATYRSAAECVEKARWLLDHPKERAEIAAAGQKRTRASHTFERRARELDHIIRTEFN